MGQCNEKQFDIMRETHLKFILLHKMLIAKSVDDLFLRLCQRYGSKVPELVHGLRLTVLKDTGHYW